MRSTGIVGIVLIILGVVFIAHDYIPPRSETHQVGVGPVGVGVHIEERSDPLPLILGGISILAGLYLIFKRS